MTIVNTISDNKYLKDIPPPFNKIRSPLNDYFIYNDITYEAYFSNNSGIYIKNYSSGVTEKFSSNMEIEYLDFIIYNNKYYLLIRSRGKYLLLYFQGDDYTEKELNINSENVFLSTDNKNVYVFYLQNNFLCKRELSDDFSFEEILSDISFEKQKLKNVMTKDGRIFFNLVVSDNTLLKNLTQFPSLKGREFTNIPFSLSNFQEIQ